MKPKQYILILLVLVTSCNRLDKNHIIGLSLEVGFDIEKLTSDYLIIIPGQGCSGCLQAARSFMNENYKNDKFKFLLTKFDSEKQLNILYGHKIVERAILDKLDVFYKGGFNSMYPAIIDLRNQSIKVKLADPDHYSLWKEINQ